MAVANQFVLLVTMPIHQATSLFVPSVTAIALNVYLVQPIVQLVLLICISKMVAVSQHVEVGTIWILMFINASNV